MDYIEFKTIYLTHLSSNSNTFDCYIDDIKEKEEKEKEKENSLKLYYKINNEIMKELENKFKTTKSKIKMEKPFYLESGKFCDAKSDYIFIYDENNFEILNKISIIYQTDKDYYFTCKIIELDNKDIIFSYDNLIYIYFNNNNYEEAYYREEKKYINDIKKLSGNKFMTIEDKGIQICYLNEETKNYELGFQLNAFKDNLADYVCLSHIYEINEKEFFLIYSQYPEKRIEIMNIDKLTLEEKIGHNRKLNDISAETKNKKEKIGLYIPKKIISLSKYNKYNKIPVKSDFSKNTSYKKRNENNIDKNNIIRYDSRGNKFYLSEIRNHRKLDNAFFSDYVIFQGNVYNFI